MKILIMPDCHGRIMELTEAFNQFLTKEYDKIILLGDYFDLHDDDASDSDMIRVAQMILSMKRTYKDRVILLIGNHDSAYLRQDPEGHRVQGFRPILHAQLYHILAPQRKDFQYAYGIKNYLFTHAGIQRNWFNKHYNILKIWGEHMGLDICDPKDLWIIIDGIGQTADSPILFETGPERGGSGIGGPLWCDAKEMLENGPIPGFRQIVGHSPVKHIYRVSQFGPDRKNSYSKTDVTFCDCLTYKTHFLTLTI